MPRHRDSRLRGEREHHAQNEVRHKNCHWHWSFSAHVTDQRGASRLRSNVSESAPALRLTGGHERLLSASRDLATEQVSCPRFCPCPVPVAFCQAFTMACGRIAGRTSVRTENDGLRFADVPSCAMIRSSVALPRLTLLLTVPTVQPQRLAASNCENPKAPIMTRGRRWTYGSRAMADINALRASV